MDFIRDLLGFSNPNIPNHQPDNPRRSSGFHEEDNSSESNGKHFNVFTDPLEIHRYFERQMDDMFRTFGFQNFGNFSRKHTMNGLNLNSSLYNAFNVILNRLGAIWTFHSRCTVYVLKIKKHFINSRYRPEQINCDNDLLMLSEEAIILCDKVITGSVRSKNFNDHIKLISLGLDSHVWLDVMRENNLMAEESVSDQSLPLDRNLDEEYKEEKPKNLREHFLKEDYVKPHYEESGKKADTDLDGKLNLGDLESIFKGSNNEQSPDIYRERKPFGGMFFNQSVLVKTIRKPDGSLESRKTIRDSQGNEETTITQKFGDKEYTIIKKLDKDGKEETQEIMVNIDEKDKAVFQQKYDDKNSFSTHFDNSLFNKFFK